MEQLITETVNSCFVGDVKREVQLESFSSRLATVVHEPDREPVAAAK